MIEDWTADMIWNLYPAASLVRSDAIGGYEKYELQEPYSLKVSKLSRAAWQVIDTARIVHFKGSILEHTYGAKSD